MDCCCALKVANGDCNISWFPAFAGMTKGIKANAMYLMVLIGLSRRLNNFLEVTNRECGCRATLAITNKR